MTAANGEFQILFEAPDDTIQPPDADGNADGLMQININFTASSNLTHYVFTLDQGGIVVGSQENFALYQSFFNNINFAVNWNIPEAFGYNGDNAIVLDIQLDVINESRQTAANGGYPHPGISTTSRLTTTTATPFPQTTRPDSPTTWRLRIWGWRRQCDV
jgi:hypothetical protein